jgi:hypothetical protein
MAERERDSTGGTSPDDVRDFHEGGDVGEGSHGAFAHENEEGVQHNDERLAGRGRNPGRGDSGFIDDIERDRARSQQSAEHGPGKVRGLEPPERDEVGA